MAFNFFSSVGIITVNKMVFKVYNFNYSTLLTTLHFLCTFAGLVVCNLAGMFEIKKVRCEPASVRAVPWLMCVLVRCPSRTPLH